MMTDPDEDMPMRDPDTATVDNDDLVGDGLADDDPNNLNNDGWDDEDSEQGGDGTIRILDCAIYSDIGQSWFNDGITSKVFLDQITAAGQVDKIRVRINSLGGDTFEAQAIYSLLTESKSKVHVLVDGIAASAASVIAMAGDKMTMRKNSMLMIHDPWTMAMGNAEDMRKQASILDSVRDSIVAVYCEKSGMSEKDMKKMMSDETWMSATQAKDKGFADEVRGKRSKVKAAGDKNVIMNGVYLDISRFRNAPALKPTIENKIIMPDTPKPDKQGLTVQSAAQLRELSPEIYNEIFNAGANAEFARIKDIEESYDDPSCAAIVKAAKQDRTKNAASISKECFNALKNSKELETQSSNRKKDSTPLNNIKGGEAPHGGEEGDDKEKAAESLAGMMVNSRNRRFGITSKN